MVKVYREVFVASVEGPADNFSPAFAWERHSRPQLRSPSASPTEESFFLDDGIPGNNDEPLHIVTRLSFNISRHESIRFSP